MKTTYRGHEITVTRERCLGGWDQLYYSIYRQADGYECAAGHTEDASPLATYVGHMKERIDAELASDDPWCESEGPLGTTLQ